MQTGVGVGVKMETFADVINGRPISRRCSGGGIALSRSKFRLPTDPSRRKKRERRSRGREGEERDVLVCLLKEAIGICERRRQMKRDTSCAWQTDDICSHHSVQGGDTFTFTIKKSDVGQPDNDARYSGSTTQCTYLLELCSQHAGVPSFGCHLQRVHTTLGQPSLYFINLQDYRRLKHPASWRKWSRPITRILN